MVTGKTEQTNKWHDQRKSSFWRGTSGSNVGSRLGEDWRLGQFLQERRKKKWIGKLRGKGAGGGLQSQPRGGEAWLGREDRGRDLVCSAQGLGALLLGNLFAGFS